MMRRWTRWPAWLCLSLMLWMVAAESAHNHPTQRDAAACSICIVAHSASPEAVSNSARPVLATLCVLRGENVVAHIRLGSSDAGIRGPPAVL